MDPQDRLRVPPGLPIQEQIQFGEDRTATVELHVGATELSFDFRVEGEAAWLGSVLLPALYQVSAPFRENGQIWRMQLDTYEREVERYGGDAGILLSEQVFEADSEAVLEMLEGVSGDEGNALRWRLALLGMDALLEDLGFGLPEKQQLVGALRQSFAEEFRVDSRLQRQLDARYRAERPELGLEVEPLRRRSLRLAPVAAALRAADLPLPELAAHYLHLHANRLLRGAARAQELVLYDFLGRLYASQQARQHRG